MPIDVNIITAEPTPESEAAAHRLICKLAMEGIIARTTIAGDGSITIKLTGGF